MPDGGIFVRSNHLSKERGYDVYFNLKLTYSSNQIIHSNNSVQKDLDTHSATETKEKRTVNSESEKFDGNQSQLSQQHDNQNVTATDTNLPSFSHLPAMTCVEHQTGSVGKKVSGNFNITTADRKLVLYFSNYNVRARFLRELNNRRQAGNVGPFFDRLKFLIYGLLDACTETVDVESIRQVMIMSQTYFRNRKNFQSRIIKTTMTNQETDSDREFLCNSELGKHRLWKNAVLWEEMFLLAVADEVSQLPPPDKVNLPQMLQLQLWDESLLQLNAQELFFASKDMYVLFALGYSVYFFVTFYSH